MSNDIRERAKQILSVFPPLRKQTNSVRATTDLFQNKNPRQLLKKAALVAAEVNPPHTREMQH